MVCYRGLTDLTQLRLDGTSGVPIYKQLADSVTKLVRSGALRAGERLPPTRELAGQLGLNRTTISAAYALLEQSGLIQGHVGRGSFVVPGAAHSPVSPTNWEAVLPSTEPALPSSPGNVEINFANSRPAGDEFPMLQFRQLAKQVIDAPEASEILQLGSPFGYSPLRRYLLHQAIDQGIATEGDDVIITNGCQQALDLIARLFVTTSDEVVVEDPVYHGLLKVFSRAGAHLISVPMDEFGIDVNAWEELLERRRPRLLVLTPSFQNPTGTTLSLERRKQIVHLAQRFQVVLIENDIYTELRYRGSALPRLRTLDESGNTILLGSYSKISFPGLRVGWAIARRAVIARLAEAKQISDLHSDQLSQAVLLRFAESGELDRHLEKTRLAGAQRLEAVLQGCARDLPKYTTFTRPEGGMNLWVELPAPLLADELLRRVQQRGVDFLPGRHFSSRVAHARALRLSFGGLSPDQITRGIRIIGDTAAEELSSVTARGSLEPAGALV